MHISVAISARTPARRRGAQLPFVLTALVTCGCGLQAGQLNAGGAGSGPPVAPSDEGSNKPTATLPTANDANQEVPVDDGNAQSPVTGTTPLPGGDGNAKEPNASSTTPTSSAQCPSFPGYKLVWSDLFNGTSLDASKWDYEVNCKGGGNNESQCYVKNPENLMVGGGQLTIRVRKGGATDGKSYTSSRITTQNKGDFKYGKFLARLKVPVGRGLWPAFWMMPTDSVYGPWPTSGELDIMEILGKNVAKSYATPHFGTRSNHLYPGGTYTLKNADFSQDFHDFAVEWNATQITWSIDEKVFWALKAADKHDWQTSSGKWPFDQRFFFILNLAIGGNFGGAIDPNITQADYVIEHVCAYQ